MAHIESAPCASLSEARAGLALILTAVLGFAAGQMWPEPRSDQAPAASVVLEDWHGNVRRSHEGR